MTARNLSLFGTGDFVRCDILESWYGLGRVGLIIGMLGDNEGVGLRAIVIGQEGQIGLVDIDHLRTVYVYNAEADLFVDKDAAERLLREGLPPDAELEE